MGMFDSVRVNCPECNNMVEFQSKAGACDLIDYNLYNAPSSILGDLHNESVACHKCGRFVTIKVQTIARVE